MNQSRFDETRHALEVVPVNFSVSSQGNATWVILATTICCMHQEERILPKYILGRVSVITVISSYLDFKGYSAVHDWTVWYRSWFVGHKSATGSTDSTQTPHYIDHVYLDRLFLLSNLTWRRAHVTAGLTGMDPNVNICIYGDCNAMLLFSYISENKSRLLFCFWDTFARRVLV